jgi:hypothetical protein
VLLDEPNVTSKDFSHEVRSLLLRKTRRFPRGEYRNSRGHMAFSEMSNVLNCAAAATGVQPVFAFGPYRTVDNHFERCGAAGSGPDRSRRSHLARRRRQTRSQPRSTSSLLPLFCGLFPQSSPNQPGATFSLEFTLLLTTATAPEPFTAILRMKP